MIATLLELVRKLPATPSAFDELLARVRPAQPMLESPPAAPPRMPAALARDLACLSGGRPFAMIVSRITGCCPCGERISHVAVINAAGSDGPVTVGYCDACAETLHHVAQAMRRPR